MFCKHACLVDRGQTDMVGFEDVYHTAVVNVQSTSSIPAGNPAGMLLPAPGVFPNARGRKEQYFD